jgi:hypothetical protein
MIEYLPLVLTGIGIIVSILYYAMTIRNQNKTRQAQLLMGLYETYRSPEFRKRQMAIQILEYNDFHDFWDKYGRDNNPDYWAMWFSVAAFYNGIGVLVRRNMLDIELVEELLANIIERSWENMGDIILDWRKFIAADKERKYDLLHGFEYLYNEIVSRGTIKAEYHNR